VVNLPLKISLLFLLSHAPNCFSQSKMVPKFQKKKKECMFTLHVSWLSISIRLLWSAVKVRGAGMQLNRKPTEMELCFFVAWIGTFHWRIACGLDITYSKGHREASFHPSVSSSICSFIRSSIRPVMVCLLRRVGKRVEYRRDTAENNIY
jgi:hypothetical protein